MNSRFPERLLWSVAILALAAGFVLTARSLLRIRGYSRGLQTCVESARRLRESEGIASRNEAAVGIFEQLPNPHPVPIAQLLKDTLPGGKYEMREQQSQETVPGWTIRRSEVSFADIELGKLAEFLETAESGRPPWRVTTCSIRSLSSTGGSGQVTLIMEALEKMP